MEVFYWWDAEISQCLTVLSVSLPYLLRYNNKKRSWLVCLLFYLPRQALENRKTKSILDIRHRTCVYCKPLLFSLSQKQSPSVDSPYPVNPSQASFAGVVQPGTFWFDLVEPGHLFCQQRWVMAEMLRQPWWELHSWQERLCGSRAGGICSSSSSLLRLILWGWF